jgi:ribosomal subunit interface protein
MQIEVSGNGIAVTPELREYAQRRLHFALGRFANRIKRVRIRLADVNGPRGGVDVHCRVRVRGKDIEGLLTTALALNPETAINEAAARMRRRIERVEERRRHGGPHRPPLL